MITLRDDVHINASPEDIFDWFENLDKNYKEWHQDHVKWVFLNGFHEGSKCYCEELMHGRLHKMKGRITKLRKNRLVEFEFSFPTSLICPGGSFIIEPEGMGSTFTATLSFRLTGVFSRFAKKRMDSVKNHMKEEGQSLRRILEDANSAD
ncbi:MAG: SRPBCC family protein [Methanobacteriota archaeon]|nr:MAG: SRPBCC family protein [Euryarchaeota archaeon]